MGSRCRTRRSRLPTSCCPSAPHYVIASPPTDGSGRSNPVQPLPSQSKLAYRASNSPTTRSAPNSDCARCWAAPPISRRPGLVSSRLRSYSPRRLLDGFHCYGTRPPRLERDHGRTRGGGPEVLSTYSTLEGADVVFGPEFVDGLGLAVLRRHGAAAIGLIRFDRANIQARDCSA